MKDVPTRALLARAAELAGTQFDAPTGEDFAALRARRRRIATSVAVGVCVVSLAAVLAVAFGGRSREHPLDERIRSTEATGSVTARQLQDYRWSTLPAAPITGRSATATVWTGRQMLIWGGRSENGQLWQDGATYTPSTHSWATLPSAPLSPRANPDATWTGTRLVIWGGVGAHGKQRDDGATYDPDTGDWTMMASAPSSVGTSASIVSTGSRVVFLTADKAFAATVIRADAFDPATNSWQVLPSIPLSPVNNYAFPTATVVGDRLVVWVGPTSFAIDSTSSSWTPAELSPADAGCVARAIYTGATIVFPPNFYSRSCGGDLAYTGGIRGLELDLATHHTRQMAYSETSDNGSLSLWTGRALLDFGGSASTEGVAQPVSQRTAAWDPTTNAWLPVPDPDSDHDLRANASWVWTGTELIGWGTYDDSRNPVTTRGVVLGP